MQLNYVGVSTVLTTADLVLPQQHWPAGFISAGIGAKQFIFLAHRQPAHGLLNDKDAAKHLRLEAPR